EEEQQHAGGARGTPRGDVGDGVADDGRQDDDDATHRQGAAVGEVGRGPVLPAALPVVPPDEEPDVQRGIQHDDDQGGSPGDEDGHHSMPPPSRSARRHTPDPWEPLSSTRSPGRSSSSSSAPASSGVPGRWTSGPPGPAPARTCSPAGPGARSTSMPSSAASRPTSACASSACAPSSSISPTTAIRRVAGIALTARSAAAIESGLAL